MQLCGETLASSNGLPSITLHNHGDLSELIIHLHHTMRCQTIIGSEAEITKNS